jgi:hypothetical protein
MCCYLINETNRLQIYVQLFGFANIFYFFFKNLSCVTFSAREPCRNEKKAAAMCGSSLDSYRDERGGGLCPLRQAFTL